MDTKIKKIRELNDNLRQNFTGARVLITRGVAELPIDKQLEIIEKVRNFSNFNKDNDPNGEHDFGAFDVDGITYFWKIDYYDVEYQYLSLTEDSDSREFMMYHMNIVMAENYVKCLSDNVKRGMREMPEKGLYGHTAPVGDLNQRTSRHQTIIVIDPVMGPIVRKLFYEYASGIYTLADLTRMAEELGFRTIRGNKAHKQTIISMLKNPFYCGFMRCYDQLYPHNYEKLISKELFDKCQDQESL